LHAKLHFAVSPGRTFTFSYLFAFVNMEFGLKYFGLLCGIIMFFAGTMNLFLNVLTGLIASGQLTILQVQYMQLGVYVRVTCDGDSWWSFLLVIRALCPLFVCVQFACVRACACVRVRACACVRACVRACVCVRACMHAVPAPFTRHERMNDEFMPAFACCALQVRGVVLLPHLPVHQERQQGALRG
jgi:hypothetical protein